MGHVNDEGLGILNPSSFALQHKSVHDRALANLAKKACWPHSYPDQSQWGKQAESHQSCWITLFIRSKSGRKRSNLINSIFKNFASFYITGSALYENQIKNILIQKIDKSLECYTGSCSGYIHGQISRFVYGVCIIRLLGLFNILY